MLKHCLVIGCLLLSGPAFSNPAVDSTIDSVTVYRDRAQVTRVAKVDLVAGSNMVRFENLPEHTERASLQASGSGGAILTDVQFKVENFKVIPDEVRQTLFARRDDLLEQKKVLDDERELLDNSKQFLDKITSKVTSVEQSDAELELNPEKWGQMLNLYSTRATEYDQKLREVETVRKALQKEIEKVEADIREAGFTEKRLKYVAELVVVAGQPGSVIIELSYIVHGPTWMPTYDVRVDTTKRQMEISYYGNIRQSSGEDWSNVELALSTANPGLGGQHPELQPWRIEEGQTKGREPITAFTAGSADRSNMFNRMLPHSESGGQELDKTTSEKMRVQTADVQDGLGAVVFVVKGESSIAADNVSHRVAISQEKFDVALRYSAVPKLAPYAYLKAKGVNGLTYPLLSGRSNVFLDGNFITASSLDLIAPQEEFWVFLGADEGVKVEHKLVKRYRSSEGLFGNRIRYAFEYEIKLHNTHSVTEDVVVWDQLPISGSEKIEVKLVEPKITNNSMSVKVDENKYIEWHFMLKPNEKRTVPFEFYIEAPADVDINGLDTVPSNASRYRE